MYEKFAYFTTPQFWFFMGILFVGVAVGLKVFFEDKGFEMNWWKWLLTALLWFLIFFSVMAAFTFLGEGETRGFWIGLALFGVIDIILGVGLWRLLSGGKKVPAKS
ncbi:MAG: hypothetical protein HOA61_01020 [Bacteroidetes bacterium]|jgi:hypothetical protein|nr:hypothetical protein [Chloroflexota bacterium]MBT4306198.1 hypothetical protein [Chloroflexota bacterium]MBT6834598.1 hypothetical protein [Bacteroidota bacterium]MBT6988453.1 hypothetical protein [Chloroflexota bacterium]